MCLVGHSLGALLSFHASLAAPDVVTCLGAWEPPLPWREEYSSALRDRPSVLGHLEDPEAAAEAFLRSMVGDRLWDRMPSAMRAERRAEGVALVADLQMCRRPEAEVDFHAVVRPTLLGCGAASAERFRWSARHLLEALPDAMLVEVAESQHGAHLSHPTEFAAFAAAARARGTQPGHGSRGEG